MEFPYLWYVVIPRKIQHILLPILVAFSLTLAGGIFGSLRAQGVELDNFSVFQYEDEVYLNWVIARGSTCNGISIERSTDDIQYEQVGYISGVCGSASAPQPYSFIDKHPRQNLVNYYRLELGLQGHSATRSIEFVYIPDGFHILPNPASQNAQFVFSNPNAREHTLAIHSASGQIVEQLTTTANVIDLDVSSLPTGLYIVRITNEYNATSNTQRLVIK